MKTLFCKTIFVVVSCFMFHSFVLTKTHQTLPQTSQAVHRTQRMNITQPAFVRGSLTVICGSMCAGKSEELIKQVGRFILAGFNVLSFKPAIDNRKLLHLDLDPLTYIPSRNGSWIECIAVSNCDAILSEVLASDATIIAIDEAHFFSQESSRFIKLIQTLVESGKKVIVAGLELDFRGEPFGPMPYLLAYADNVIKLNAICSICGTDTFCLTQRIVDGKPAHYNDPLIVVGATQYEPRCRACHIILKD